jgi:hypothetical protein
MTTLFGAVVQRASVPAKTVNPLIQLGSKFVVVKKSYTSPARVKVTLKVSSRFGRTGTLSRAITNTSGKIAIFTTATGTTEIDFDTNTNTTFSAAQLNAGVPLFAEATQPSSNLDDFQLTLTLAAGATPVGSAATATLTAVELTLDVIAPGSPPIVPMPQPPDPPPAPGTATDKWFLGRVLNVQDPGNQQDRAEIIVRPVSPSAFAQDLVLRQVKVNTKNQITGLDTKVQLFDSKTPGPLQVPPAVETAKANPLVFNAGSIGVAGQSFFAEGHKASALTRDTGYQVGINGAENDGDRIAMTVVVAPLLSVDSPFVVVKKPHTNPARRKVTLRTSAPSTLTGTLTKTGAGPVKIFKTAAGSTEITFDGTDNVFTGAQLGSASGVQLFAESTSASAAPEDFELTLTLSGGSLPLAAPITIKLTAVEITLDVAQTKTSVNVTPPLLSSTDKINPGVFVIKQDAFTHERARLVVQPTKPVVTVTLRLEAFNASVQAFGDEQAAAGQLPVANPDPIPSGPIPAAGEELFVEGAAASGAFFDTGFRLGIDGLENDADHVVITVLADPSLLGPFAVGEHEYTRLAKLSIPAITETLSDLTLADPGFGPPAAQSTGAFDAKIHALVRYPATAAGVDTPVSGVLPKYPLVVIAHGNHAVVSGGVPVESFRGLEYLARHLASYGYIAISVDLDVVNTSALGFIFPGIVQRGLVILEHIAHWGVLNGGDPIFAGKFDDSQIALIGHSRGGEAVVSAQKTNIDDARGLNIKAVVSISQTDFLGIVHATTPYLVVYGSADGDVSIGWPFRLYDRASGFFKAMMFVYGANHNRFSTSPDWLAHLDLDPLVDGRIISEADHQNVAKGYSLGFLQLILRSVGDHVLLFKNNARPSAISAAVEIHNQVQDSTPRLTVDDFEQGAFTPATAHGPQLASRATTNTVGQAVSQTGLVVPEPPASNPAINSLTNALTEGSLRHRDLDFFWSDAFGELMAWDAVGATYTQGLGTKDVSSFDVLSFRVTQRFGVARNPAPPAASPDFSIALKDADGNSAVLRVGTISVVPVPYNRVDDASLTKSALTTIRIPLAAFQGVNPLLKLDKLSSIVFQFAQTAKGEIAIDDLEFSN